MIDLTRIATASYFATVSHIGQPRSDGTPYISHPLRVMGKLESLSFAYGVIYPVEMYEAALLHDIVEDTDNTIEQIQSVFGETVAGLVQELTIDKEERAKIGRIPYMINSMVNMSNEALTLKLCDRFDNVSDLATAKSESWRIKYSDETTEIIIGLLEERGGLDKIQLFLALEILGIVIEYQM